MPRVLKQKAKPKLARINKADWELWLFVAALVTILGFFVQTRSHLENPLPYFRLQSKADLYDIRVPNNNRAIQDRLETGR